MNIYQGGGTSQEKIIPIKRHFASLIFGIISPLVGYGPPDKYSFEISKSRLVCNYKTTYIIQTPNLSIQYIQICIKLQAVCQ